MDNRLREAFGRFQSSVVHEGKITDEQRRLIRTLSNLRLATPKSSDPTDKPNDRPQLYDDQKEQAQRIYSRSD
jgi:hypothetical protein